MFCCNSNLDKYFLGKYIVGIFLKYFLKIKSYFLAEIVKVEKACYFYFILTKVIILDSMCQFYDYEHEFEEKKSLLISDFMYQN